MTDTTPACPVTKPGGGSCGKPCPDATICRDCTDQLGRDLSTVPWLREQLDLSLSRQSAGGRQNGGRSSDKPLPYDVGASDAIEILGAALRRATARPAWRYSHGSIAGMAVLLAYRIDVVRQMPEAATVAKEVGNAVAKARRSINRPPPRWFAGPCDGNGYTIRGQGAPEQGCGDWLYVRPEAHDVKCKACTTVYDVGQRRAWMVEAAEDYLVNAATLSRFVSRLGTPVKANTIVKWKERGRLEQRGTDEQGHPQYRVGDVLDLVHGEAARAAGKAAKRHAVTSSSKGG